LERQEAIDKGTLPPSSEQYKYDGDISALPMIPTKDSDKELDNSLNLIYARLHTGEIVQPSGSKAKKLCDALHLRLSG
jgi:hypothetical protein